MTIVLHIGKLQYIGWLGCRSSLNRETTMILSQLVMMTLLGMTGTLVSRAQPAPGDVFREYYWTNISGEGDGFIRVGGRLGYGGGPLQWPDPLDLQYATKAEVVIEKLLCHDGTRGLAISVNSNAWVNVPESPCIPTPQWEYQHHTYPIVPVPLSWLRTTNNHFQLRVSNEHPWNWPQMLIYGVHLRIYYDPHKKAHPIGRMVMPRHGDTLGTNVQLIVDVPYSTHGIRSVLFLGEYEDVNYEGDGIYRQWHYHYRRGMITGHIGTVTSRPWMYMWDTSWVPDQPKPFRLAAWITDNTGLTYFTEPITNLTFMREGLSVELCKPYDVPTKWVTRYSGKAQKFRIFGNLEKIHAARLVWVSWSPGYMNGLYINGERVFENEGPRYAYYRHSVTLTNLAVLQHGENTLETGLTPRHDGKMVHGMEVNWPGIMVLIQYHN